MRSGMAVAAAGRLTPPGRPAACAGGGMPPPAARRRLGAFRDVLYERRRPFIRGPEDKCVHSRTAGVLCRGRVRVRALQHSLQERSHQPVQLLSAVPYAQPRGRCWTAPRGGWPWGASRRRAAARGTARRRGASRPARGFSARPDLRRLPGAARAGRKGEGGGAVRSGGCAAGAARWWQGPARRPPAAAGGKGVNRAPRTA